MEQLVNTITISINPRVYLKDPESSDLGKKMVEGSIDLIDELGFEAFTFKKLADKISTTEASIYRYFESKHKLLLYITSWYWAWLEYRLVFQTINVESAEKRLRTSLQLITETVEEDSSFSHINEIKLNRIVITESSKSYLNRQVDAENKEGAFLGYKQLVARIADMVTELNPDYPYPHMLVSTVIEGAHLQRYFAEHLPRLTDQVKGEDSVCSFYADLVFQAIRK